MRLSRKFVLLFSMATCLVALVGYSGHKLLVDTEAKTKIITDQISPVVYALRDIRYYVQAIISNSSEMLMHAAMENNMPGGEHFNDF